MDFSRPFPQYPDVVDGRSEAPVVIEECYGTVSIEYTEAISSSALIMESSHQLCDVKVQACILSNGGIAHELTDFVSEESFRSFPVVARSSSCFLRSRDAKDSREIAVLNARHSSGLVRIAYMPSVRLEAVLMNGVRIRQNDQDAEIQRVFTVGINVYGREMENAHVGRILSDSKLFLQHPYFSLEVAYRNPHWLSCNTTSITYTETETASTHIAEPADDQKSIDLVRVLDSLPRIESLKEAEVDTSLVKTTLKSHQKEALDFMLKRELGEMPPSSKLWSEEDWSPESSSYRNKITKSLSHILPDEPPSGLIADEMGLGKSLATLAVIVSSAERARYFSTGESAGSLPGSHRLTHSTLVIVPSAIMIDEWLGQVNSHLSHNALRTHRYHGQAKEIDYLKLNSIDVIFTTYSTVEYDYLRGRRFLSSIKWFRVVFDEAHEIRNPATKRYKAASALAAKHKWCLTGTPIQNKLEDLEALLKILQIPLFEESSWFNWSIVGPIKRKENDCFANLRCLLASMCLRRTKSVADIPDPEEHRPLITYTAEEADAERNMITDFDEQIETARRNGDFQKARKLVLRLTIRRRIFANTGVTEILGSSEESDDMDPEERLSLLQQNDEGFCNQCLKDIAVVGDDQDRSGFFYKCAHLLCTDCAPFSRSDPDCPAAVTDRLCPTCSQHPRADILEHETKSVGTTLQRSTAGTAPSKLLAVVRDIQRHKGKAKSLVFSCWTKSLDMLAQVARLHNINFTRIDGSMSLSERRKSRKSFQQDPKVDAMLATIGTAALGLNLVAANRIHVLEPQWNPAMESQAIGRAVRIGQLRGVVIVRYIIQGSFEEAKVIPLQQGKIKLASKGFEGAENEDKEERLQRQIDFACWQPDDAST